MSDDSNVIPMIRPQPKDMSETEVNKLWDFAAALMHADARRLNPETILGNKPVSVLDGLDIDRAADAAIERAAQTLRKLPELPMLTTTRRHLPDILECRPCGYQFPREASCPMCGSTNFGVYMKAPSRAEVRNHTADRASHLTEIDPEWESRFAGDVDRAWAFYKTPAIELPATSAERELDESIDEGLDFDSGLTDEDARP
jgi:hypothetical protein